MEKDEDLECRICRGGLEVGALLYPCKCSGSIRYVHEDCIKLWLQRTRAKTCELCHHSFKFSPVYAPDTPSRLPTSIFLLGFLRIFGKHLLLLLRLVEHIQISYHRNRHSGSLISLVENIYAEKTELKTIYRVLSYSSGSFAFQLGHLGCTDYFFFGHFKGFSISKIVYRYTCSFHGEQIHLISS